MKSINQKPLSSLYEALKYISKTFNLYQHIMRTDYEDVHMFSMQQRKYNKFNKL